MAQGIADRKMVVRRKAARLPSFAENQVGQAEAPVTPSKKMIAATSGAETNFLLDLIVGLSISGQVD